jgi:hypothetical protein
MPRWIPRLLLLLAFVWPLTLQAATPPACPMADEFVLPDEPLARVTAAIAAGGPVEILAIGSATTVGDQLVGDRHAAFPYRMVEALHAALPRVAFGLTLRGGRGMTAEDMLPSLRDTLRAQHFTLVLWQTGTVEAVRGQRPDGLMAALQDGIALAGEAGADVVLVDPQFSRFLRANTDLDPYEEAMQQVAVLPGVVLFHRFDLMQSWVDSGDIDLERVHRDDRTRMMALLNTCLGDTLARFVLNGAGIAARATQR